MKIIDPSLLKHSITGLNLTGETLEEEMGSSTVMLLFLRHFGCLFSREMVLDIRRICENNPFAPQPIFFFQGNIEQGKQFFDQYWPQARAIADEQRDFYSGFEVTKGSFMQLFGAEVWKCGLRATAKGIMIGKPIGNPFTLSLTVLAQRNLILWQYHSKHAGDFPDYSIIEQYADSPVKVLQMPE